MTAPSTTTPTPPAGTAPATTARKRGGAQRRRGPAGSFRRAVGPVAYYGTAALFVFAFLAPIIWTAISSVFGSRATGGGSGFGWANYQSLIAYGEGLWVYVGNTATVAVIAVVGTLLVSVLGGYAFARYEFPLKKTLFIGTLAILMVPHATILVPIYQLLRTVGLQNSLVGVALVMVMFQLPIGIFMMRNAFEALPRELEEAAMLDGCNSFTALGRIMLPAVVPSMLTVVMFSFLAAWNEFLTPLMLLTKGSSFTLPVALVSLRTGEYGAIDLGSLQAGIVVAAIPCLVLFVLLQRHYVSGFTAGAVRG